jgi:hypothetical protein
MKRLSVVFLLFVFFFYLPVAAIRLSGGKVVEYKNFSSSFVKARNVTVWLPDGYTASKKYNVIYMHDGQMLFDSTTTWNHQEWQVDEVVSTLLQKKEIEDCIIIGIWNISEDRFFDYFPQKSINYMSADNQRSFTAEFGGNRFDADNYLKFIVGELKPFIDKTYSTYTDRQHTFMMGSSMGGLISLYGLCEHPDVFGGVACLSIHSLMITSSLKAEANVAIAAPAFVAYLKAALPQANTAKIYMDFGSKTLDSYYAPYQEKIDEVLYQRGWRRPYWTTNFYPGLSHSETDWARRLFIPLMFLIGR